MGDSLLSDTDSERTKGETSQDNGKMFVGGLSWQTTTESLKEYFSKFGQIQECMVMKDPATKRSRKFGFVTFVDPETIIKVLATTPHELDNKTIDPKVAFPKKGQPKLITKTKKVFVGGISVTTNIDDIKQYFETFGKIEDAMLMFDKNTNRHRGFGFITFETDDIAEKVCEIHYHEINNKMVECKKAQPKEVLQAVSASNAVNLGGISLSPLSRQIGALGGYGLSPPKFYSPTFVNPFMYPTIQGFMQPHSPTFAFPACAADTGGGITSPLLTPGGIPYNPHTHQTSPFGMTAGGGLTPGAGAPFHGGGLLRTHHHFSSNISPYSCTTTGGGGGPPNLLFNYNDIDQQHHHMVKPILAAAASGGPNSHPPPHHLQFAPPHQSSPLLGFNSSSPQQQNYHHQNGGFSNHPYHHLQQQHTPQEEQQQPFFAPNQLAAMINFQNSIHAANQEQQQPHHHQSFWSHLNHPAAFKTDDDDEYYSNNVKLVRGSTDDEKDQLLLTNNTFTPSSSSSDTLPPTTTAAIDDDDDDDTTSIIFHDSSTSPPSAVAAFSSDIITITTSNNLSTCTLGTTVDAESASYPLSPTPYPATFEGDEDEEGRYDGPNSDFHHHHNGGSILSPPAIQAFATFAAAHIPMCHSSLLPNTLMNHPMDPNDGEGGCLDFGNSNNGCIFSHHLPHHAAIIHDPTILTSTQPLNGATFMFHHHPFANSAIAPTFESLLFKDLKNATNGHHDLTSSPAAENGTTCKNYGTGRNDRVDIVGPKSQTPVFTENDFPSLGGSSSGGVTIINNSTPHPVKQKHSKSQQHQLYDQREQHSSESAADEDDNDNIEETTPAVMVNGHRTTCLLVHGNHHDENCDEILNDKPSEIIDDELVDASLVNKQNGGLGDHHQTLAGKITTTNGVKFSSTPIMNGGNDNSGGAGISWAAKLKSAKYHVQQNEDRKNKQQTPISTSTSHPSPPNSAGEKIQETVSRMIDSSLLLAAEAATTSSITNGAANPGYDSTPFMRHPTTSPLQYYDDDDDVVRRLESEEDEIEFELLLSPTLPPAPVFGIEVQAIPVNHYTNGF